MATRKKAKKATFTPANRFLRYKIQNSATPNTETSHYIDIAKDLSACNRRLYRQGRVYQIASISVTSTNTPNGYCSFITAPDTWVTRAAWNRGFEMFKEMNKRVLDMPGSMSRKGRWHDFKVYLDDSHRSYAGLRARDSGNNQAGSGEWVYSTYQSPDGTATNDDFTAHLLGDHSGSGGAWNSISLIKSYGEARASVQSDEPLVDSDGSADPLLNLFDDGTVQDDIANDLANDGDQPPYKVLQGGSVATIGEHYPGSSSNLPKGMVNRLATVGTQGGVAAPTVMLPGFTAIAGLLEVEVSSGLANDEFDVIIELAPGNYKGVAAFDI